MNKWLFLIWVLFFPQIVLNAAEQRQLTPQQKLSPYAPMDFSYLIGKLPGIQDDVLKLHFKLYEGYVTNTNKLLKELHELVEKGDQTTPLYAGLQRMLGWEYDGMRLHELYFSGLGGNSTLSDESPLLALMNRDFGDYQGWMKDFKATGLIRGVGWAALYLEPNQGRLVNVWINEHDKGHLSGATPLLLMDVWEHAYIAQYGTDRKGYIEAFFKNIDWKVVEERLEKAQQKLRTH